jgi:hypothetical protein
MRLPLKLQVVLLLAFTSYAADLDLTIVPGQRAGVVKARTSESELQRMFGAAQVQREKIEVGEGFVCDGAVLFPKDPLRTANIIWKDVSKRAFPFSVEVNTLHYPTSRWRTEEGIRLGTTLKELEKLNGKPFKLAGFGWDYSGTVLSWEGGRLEKYQSKDPNGHRLILRLNYENKEPPVLSDQEAIHVSGDRDFFSSDPVMQKANPKVYQLDYRFDQSASCNAVFRR